MKSGVTRLAMCMSVHEMGFSTYQSHAQVLYNAMNSYYKKMNQAHGGIENITVNRMSPGTVQESTMKISHLRVAGEMFERTKNKSLHSKLWLKCSIPKYAGLDSIALVSKVSMLTQQSFLHYMGFTSTQETAHTIPKLNMRTSPRDTKWKTK